MIAALTLALLISQPVQAQEYIGIKSSNKGNCKLYRERYIVDSTQFKNDLKKQVAYRNKLIATGRNKVTELNTAEIKTPVVLDSQVQDDVSGSDLLWTFEYCVYDKPISEQTPHLVGTTGLAQKVFGNPDGTYTIEYPKLLHAGQIYYLESIEHYEEDPSDRSAILNKICKKRFGFTQHVSHSNMRVQDNSTVRLNKNGTVISTDNPYSSSLVHRLTCQ